MLWTWAIFIQCDIYYYSLQTHYTSIILMRTERHFHADYRLLDLFGCWKWIIRNTLDGNWLLEIHTLEVEYLNYTHQKWIIIIRITHVGNELLELHTPEVDYYNFSCRKWIIEIHRRKWIIKITHAGIRITYTGNWFINLSTHARHEILENAHTGNGLLNLHMLEMDYY